jgi:hypothetical protein
MAVVRRPRTRNWAKSRRAINEYVQEVEAANRAAVGAKGGH